MTPIEKMLLKNVEWVECENDSVKSGDLPYATHEGVLDIAGMKLRCYRLNTGQAIFNSDDMTDFFEGFIK